MTKSETIRVSFENIGRDNQSWEADVKPTQDAIIAEARRGGGLMSRNIWLAAGGYPGEGIIVVAGREVGRFRTSEEIEP